MASLDAIDTGYYFDDYRNMEIHGSAVVALAALAQPTRLAVYRLLVKQGESGLAAGEIAAQLAVSPATLSFHLKELAHAGLVRSRQEGRFVYYAADFEQMNALVAYLTENCCSADDANCAPTKLCLPPQRAKA